MGIKMSVKTSVRILLVMFAITTFHNLAKIFMPFAPSQSTREPFDNYTASHKMKYNRSSSFNWDSLIVCSEISTEMTSTPAETANVTTELDLCPEIPPGLGPVGTGETMVKLSEVQNTYTELKAGGIYKEQACRARQKVALIIPYSGPKRHLNPFLYFMHPFLMKQQLEYQIFVVEYSNKSAPFNRGHLINIGVTEALKLQKDGWSCLIIHEASLLPLNMRNLYRCSWYPRQLVGAFEREFKTSLDTLLPEDKKLGVIAVTPDMIKVANGFSNSFLHRVAYYENFNERLILANYTIEKTDATFGLFRVLKHVPFNRTQFEFNTHIDPVSPYLDGISTLSYTLDHLDYKYFYTHINVTFRAAKDIHQEYDEKLKKFAT